MLDFSISWSAETAALRCGPSFVSKLCALRRVKAPDPAGGTDPSEGAGTEPMSVPEDVTLASWTDPSEGAGTEPMIGLPKGRERRDSQALPRPLGPRQRDLGSSEMKSGFTWADSDSQSKLLAQSPASLLFLLGLGSSEGGGSSSSSLRSRVGGGVVVVVVPRAIQASGCLWQL